MKDVKSRLGIAILAMCTLVALPAAHALSELVFEDIFGRRINERGLILVDWDGQIANPAIKIFVKPPSDATFPATAVVSSTQTRLYFDLPSTAGANGPAKTLSFANLSTTVPMLVSIFPDRDTNDEDQLLMVEFTAANGAKQTQTLKIHVTDQDKTLPPTFLVTVDFSRDQTGFFNDATKRNIVRQAAEDWAYFIGDMNLNLVPASAEQTFIWNPDGFNSGNHVQNASAYRGFLLYAYGISAASPPFRSGGEPSFTGGFQASGATQLPLKRSGGVEIEIKGNFNTLGWFLTTNDDDWWKASNLGNEQNDLYSIARHEIGHSLIFNPSHTRFGNFKSAGQAQDPQVLAYHGSHPGIDASDHLNGSIDRLSRKGAFGYEYFGDVPRRRWLITKLDLLIAQAIGYTLRPTSAFAALEITTNGLPRGAVSSFYSQMLRASGGIPFYDWSVIAGALPGGLALDPFTGLLSGHPTAVGTFNFTVRLRDYDAAATPVTRAFSIRIEATPFAITAIDRNEANVSIGFTTVADRTYRVESRDDFTMGSWGVLFDNVAGTGGVVTVIDPAAINLGKRFYRAVELQAPPAASNRGERHATRRGTKYRSLLPSRKGQ